MAKCMADYHVRIYGHFPPEHVPPGHFPPGVGHLHSHSHVYNITDKNVQALFVQITATNLSENMIL